MRVFVRRRSTPSWLTELRAALARGREQFSEAFVWGRERVVRRWSRRGEAGGNSAV